MLIDSARIFVKGGSGGNGCSSLYKDIYHRKGIPDGGVGGEGGDIVLKSDPNLQTLLDFRYNQHYRAEDGHHGGSNHKAGKRGADRIVKVPVGTIIIDAGNDMVIRDLDEPGKTIVVAKGGAGGKGNSKYREATPGLPGEERTLVLELKFVADVGIIGFPNAGKSTLASRISRAQTKIAPYPFTTKNPILGAVRSGESSFVVADMPGLIEGAHTGRGLGDRFLRHIERTRVLVHLVEMVPPDGSDPVDNFKKLEKELKLYSVEVFAKPRLVVASKMDVGGAIEAYERFRKKIRKKVMAISAVKGEGLEELVSALRRKIKNVKG